MTLYHPSTLRIEKPDIYHSRPHLDFGVGFYMTLLQSQAIEYGARFLHRDETAILNVYELDDDIEIFSRHVFTTYNEEWLDFVTACRKGLPHATFDIIEGGIADDKVFNTVDLYFSGIITKEQALDQLKYKQPNHQLCITSQELLDHHLHFIDSHNL